MIGPLTEEERREKIQNYLDKKKRKNEMKKYSYTVRK